MGQTHPLSPFLGSGWPKDNSSGDGGGGDWLTGRRETESNGDLASPLPLTRGNQGHQTQAPLNPFEVSAVTFTSSNSLARMESP
jgi:hypothetical protein